MAATVSPWSKPGAWALDAEEQDAAELLNNQNSAAAAAAASTAAPAASAADFPSLSAAAATKTSRKKKPQALTLAEFSSYSGAAKPASEPAGLTHDDRVSLPTGPRQRTEEEIRESRRGGGGGFRSFDRNGRGGGGERDRERPSGGGGRDMGPSRADEVDNWASVKKPSSGGFERRDSGGFERRDSGGFERRDSGRERGGFFESKADEAGSWFSNKSYSGSGGAAPPPRYDRDRRGFGLSNGGGGGGSDSSSWGKSSSNGAGVGVGGGGDSGSRPRLNLQPRTLPVASASASASPAVAAVKPKGANPFGAARPREEVLAEKGQDWKKMDEELEAMKIKEVSELSDGFAKRSFGNGNGNVRAEASWRKPVADGQDNGNDTESGSQSAENNDEDVAEN